MDKLKEALQYGIDIHTSGRTDGPMYHHVARFLALAKEALDQADNDDADNVLILPVITSNDIPAERILRAAIKADLDKAVILGYDSVGDEYFASSIADGGAVLWLLERCKKKLIDID